MVGTVRLLPNLERWLGKERWDLIHFNCGLHDILDANREVHATREEYEKNLERILARLKGTGAALVWASTTPVPEGARGRRNEDVVAYNAAAGRLMEREGIPVEDLYGFALPQLERIQKPANVHFTTEGSRVLAQKVAETLQRELRRRSGKAHSRAPGTRAHLTP
jgi:acyl-CoA thioesterase-1